MPETSYSPEIAELVLSEMRSGKTVLQIVKEHQLPVAASTIRGWAFADTCGFKEPYEEARAAMAHAWAEELQEIASDDSRDTLDSGKGRFGNGAAVQRDKLRIETLRWLMARFAPKSYGDKIQAEHSGTIKVEISKDDAAL